MAGAVLVEEAIVSSRIEFQERVYELRKPCLLKGLDIGSAPLLWTPEYLWKMRRKVCSCARDPSTTDGLYKQELYVQVYNNWHM